MNRRFQAIGAASAFLAVAAGAMGAHGGAPDPASIDIAARYQIYHALALLILGFLPDKKIIGWAGYLFISGTVLFSGSLYLAGLTGARDLIFLVPIGGTCFLLGWACLVSGLIRE